MITLQKNLKIVLKQSFIKNKMIKDEIIEYRIFISFKTIKNTFILFNLIDNT